MNCHSKYLQGICRNYLSAMKAKAMKYGLGTWLQGIIDANERGECEATEDEVEMLARMVDDERVQRTEVPKILGKSYRQCVDDYDFDEIKKLRYVWIYSKISVLLHKTKKRNV